MYYRIVEQWECIKFDRWLMNPIWEELQVGGDDLITMHFNSKLWNGYPPPRDAYMFPAVRVIQTAPWEKETHRSFAVVHIKHIEESKYSETYVARGRLVAASRSFGEALVPALAVAHSQRLILEFQCEDFMRNIPGLNNHGIPASPTTLLSTAELATSSAAGNPMVQMIYELLKEDKKVVYMHHSRSEERDKMLDEVFNNLKLIPYQRYKEKQHG